MTDLKMIEKIKALLAKAASTDHEAEAELFFAKAYELMQKHQLSEADLDKTDPVNHEHVAHRKGQAAPDWDFKLMFAVAEYFGCKCIQIPDWGNHPKTGRYQWLGHYMDLFGRESARITTLEMHKYLVATVRRLGRAKAAEDSRLNADAWSRRIGQALRQRIYTLAPKPEKAATAAGKQALVTVNQTLALYKETWPNTQSIKGRPLTNDAAREIAQGIGLNVQVNKGGTLALR